MLEKEARLDPRAVRTRQYLQQAMGELLGEKRFHEISVQDITARAGVNRATFYAHFVDKYDLLNTSIREMYQNMLDEKLPAQPVFNRANMRLLIITVFEFLEGFIGHCSPGSINSEQGLMAQQVQVHTQTILRGWLERSGAVAQHELEAVSSIASWMIFGPIVQVTWERKKVSADTVAEQLLPLIEAGLGAYMHAGAT